MSRTVSLILVDGDGAPAGALPPFDVDLPYWQEVSCVVRGARERYGVDVTVLRLLAAERPAPHGGSVTYLAQVGDVGGRRRVDPAVHPHRAPYAWPGGPAASLRWASDVLAELGHGVVSDVEQQRTWNLSAIWRLGTARGPVWLKQVPRFFTHEATVLAWIADRVAGERLVPPLLAAGDDGRMLLAHVEGDDLYGADLATRDAIAADMHRIQLATRDKEVELIRAGVPDRRAVSLLEWTADVVARYGGGEPALHALVDGLPERLSTVESCGLPDTLVHGDLHPGNVRGTSERRALIDWGDSFIGHPAFDILRLTEDAPPAAAAQLIDAWAARWRAAVPGCAPERTVELLRPVEALRSAAVYANFLDNIEPSEHPYHVADVPACLRAAVDQARRSPP
ncbi:phosphotransferase family protein [Micromonospora sp. CPCC 206061]|uniref:phosphotransferase family protein n=1 Tax=Micromonospora sp. CPCC 206061 TaxID=3122410 RepID=UPI002FEEFDC6